MLKKREKHSILRAKHDKDHALEHKAADGLSTKLHKAVLDRHTLEALKLYLEYESHNSFGYIVLLSNVILSILV